jgi:ubiquinone/menaquinone biosynthesis C-methylase UbiE
LLNKKNLPKVQAHVGDAQDLRNLKDETFDMVLCLGPLYHLPLRDQKQKVLKEINRVCKPSGIIALACIGKQALLISDFVKRGIFSPPESWDDEEKSLTKGCCNADSPGLIRDMAKDLGLEEIDHLSTDGISYLLAEKLKAASEETFLEWMSFHKKTCRFTEYGLHHLFLFRKGLSGV